MILIDRTDIERWGETFDAKGAFPKLIAKLIMETTPRSTLFQVPSGSAVFIEGWDGIVVCQEDTNYVPQGTSLWEIGVNGEKSKAEKDYRKRTEDSLGFNKLECTYIFVTTNIWTSKDEWANEKASENIWKGVRVYDSRNISEWLENSPVSSRWFSVFHRSHPYDGIFTADEFWKTISVGPQNRKLHPGIVTSGRLHEVQQLSNFLDGPPGLKAIRASTKEEAITFVVASAFQFQEKNKEFFFSKSLVVDTIPNFHGIRINKNSLNIIAKLEDASSLYSAVDRHHVLLPLGPDDPFNSQDVIILPRIDREGQIDALCNMNLSRDESERFSREAARDFTILKKLLGYPPVKNKWQHQELIKEIIPAILAGRWSDVSKADKKILETLAGEPYGVFSEKLIKWLRVEAPPLINIGTNWRLTSPLDGWISLSNLISKNYFERLQQIFLEVFNEVHPRFNLPSPERTLFSNSGKEPSYSSWLREGLSQTMILIGLYGDSLKIHNELSNQAWVDSIIEKLFEGASGELWASLNDDLPLIAEASPNSFLNAVKQSLDTPGTPIMKMFEEEESVISPNSNHTGLLWALEGLAWDTDYFWQSSMLLSRLSVLDPGGSLTNRPINSLREIFKSWQYQTFAPLEERIAAVEEMLNSHFSVGWSLGLSMLPEFNGVAYPTHKVRWRMFDKSFDRTYTYEEIYLTYTAVTNLLLKHSGNHDALLSALIERSDNLRPSDRVFLIEYIRNNKDRIRTNDQNLSWHAIRKILSNHRTHSAADWALSRVELEKYEELYHLLQPEDLIDNTIWIFQEHWPLPPEKLGSEKLSYSEEEEFVRKIRYDGLKKIYETYGFDRIISLISQIKEHWIFGQTLADLLTDEDKILELIDLIKNNDRGTLLVIQGFLNRKFFLSGMDWFIDIYSMISSHNLSENQLASLFLSLPQELRIWKFIDETSKQVHESYWRQVHPFFWNLPIEERLFGVDELLRVSRFISAIYILYHNIEEIPSNKLIEVLDALAVKKVQEERRLEHYSIEKIIGSLEKRNDVKNDDLIRMEWLYLSFLTSYRSSHKPYLLHDELSKNPKFFTEVLSWIYKSENEQPEDISPETKQNRSSAAYKLLNSWKKIPGVEQSGKIDLDYLWRWISEVREEAKQKGRLRVADMHIGQILAQYPETVEPWPPSEICEVIESLNSDSIKRNFSAAVFNKRGSSVRGVFDGGSIERKHASYFRKQASSLKKKYPITAQILQDLSDRYDEDAREADQSAEWEKLDH